MLFIGGPSVMKIGKLTLVSAAILALGAVVPSAGAQESVQATRNRQSDASLAAGTAINAELNSSIDSKKAKSGDTVMAHTTEAVKSGDDRTILPKGTKLIGHITQASAKGDTESALGIGFDKAILKGGEEVPLSVTIQALAAPASASSSAPYMDTMPSAGGPSTSPGSGTNKSSMGGNRGGTAGNPGSYPRANGAGSEPGAVGGANSSGELAPNSRGVIGLNGLQLTASNNAQVSVISSSGKNVHLDGGTRLLLVAQTVAAAAVAPGN
jgi:hypothetical protein